MANNWHSGVNAFESAGGAIVRQSPILQISTNDASPDGDISTGRKRKRSSVASEHDGRNSVDSSLLGSPLTGKHRHQPGVKRACNDCRQQKVSSNTMIEAEDGGVSQC